MKRQHKKFQTKKAQGRDLGRVSNTLTLASVGGESGLTRNVIFSALAKSPHGQLKEYVEIGRASAKRDPEFFAHLLSWNGLKGAIRDAKVALPVIALSVPEYAKEKEFKENAYAHLAKLGPRELERAFRFAREIQMPGRGRAFVDLVKKYLKMREGNWGVWQRVAIQHRSTLANLYALVHLKPKAVRMGKILFENFAPAGSIFEAVRQLKGMSPLEAGGTIAEMKIPFLIASGALGEKMKDTDLLLALINRMTPLELANNATMLEKLGVKERPALKAAWDAKIEELKKSKKSVLKTGHQAEKVKDADLKAQLQGAQEAQIKKLSVEGNWIVLADKSPSMAHSIEAARHISAALAKFVKGKVTLIFFDGVPARVYDVTGLSYDRIKDDTRHVRADGSGTSIGCGIDYAILRNVEADGIAIVSDGGHNTAPYFSESYKKLCTKLGKDIPVYFYNLEGDPDALTYEMKLAGLVMEIFDLRGSVLDYYSLPNLVQTMRTNRFSLMDEVMEVPLLKLEEVFRKLEKAAESDSSEILLEEEGEEVAHA